MEVILKEDFPQLGFTGDSVKVKPGFARNFLIPRGIAVVANTRQANIIKHEMQAINARKARLKELATEKKAQVEALALEFKLKAGEDGKIFGAITSQNIQESMKKEGVEIDRKQIKLSDSLKQEGDYTISIKLHSEVNADLKVSVGVEKYQRPTRKKGDKKQDKKFAKKAKDESAQNEEVKAQEGAKENIEEAKLN